MAALASPKYVALASTVALLTAGFLLVARLLKLGFIADFLSQTVLVGFLTGVGFQVGIAVLGEMLGLEVHSRRTVVQLAEVIRNLPRVHLPSLMLSALVVTGVLTLGRFAPRIPAPLIAVAGAIAASAAWDFAAHGISVIGPVAGGLPHLGLPGVGWREIETLIPIAGSCFVMIVAQSAATARIYSARHHQTLDENADLVGLSAANAAAGLIGAFVVNGSPTQTAMMEASGGRSQVAHVATSAVVGLVLLFLTHPLQYLPRCVLGAIVFIVAIRLVDLRGLVSIRRESPGEYLLAATTAGVVVLVGVEQGIVLAMVLSLLRIVRHSYHPHTAVLTRDEHGVWQLNPVAPGVLTEPGVVIYRFGAALFYANAGRFADEIRLLVGPGPSSLRWVLVDAGAITQVDYTAARVVRQLHQELAKRGVELVFAHVRSDLKPDLDRHHLTGVIGPDRIFDSLHEALACFHRLPLTGTTPLLS
jgi:MFS superfamily sulfate permease-like transporter